MPFILTPEQYAQHQARVRSQRSEMRAAEAQHRVNAGPDTVTAVAAPPPSRRASGPAPLERDIQAAILALLRVHPRVAWAVRMNSGVAEYASGDGTVRRVRFAFAGCPDILGQLRDGRLLAIEVKRADGRVTEDQVAFLARAARHHALAFVARSVDDVRAMLDDRKDAP